MHTVIGVMGGGTAGAETARMASELGTLIAQRDWVLLNGGRNCGVMAASAAGARAAGGLTIGILPDDATARVAPGIDIPILTGMGDARNVINVLSSRVVIAMSGGAGTVSEVAHALKLGRPVITLGLELGDVLAEYRAAGRLVSVSTPADAVAAVERFLAEEPSP